MNIRLPALFKTPLFSAPVCIALAASLLLAACASPGTPATPAASDPIHRHALVRPASPAPQWEGLRERISTATAPLPGIKVGAADAQGVRIEIPVADGFSSGSTAIRPSLASALEAIAPALTDDNGVTMVIKHWRQDWVYQPQTVLTYAGPNRWTLGTVDRTRRSCRELSQRARHRA